MAHRQLHGLADTNNHNGITMDLGHLMVADASGLPADGGVAVADLVGKDGSGNVTITGNLTVQGQSFQADHKITTGDTLILINNGEVGAGVTNVKAGLDIDRGTLMPYRFVFNEATDDFRIGEYFTVVTLGTGEGNAFTVGEKVTGVLLTATSVAYVVAKTADTLTLRGVSSAFVADMVITGATSAATGTQVGAQAITDSTQAVSTRQDNPTDTGVAFWNATASRFDTAATLTYVAASGLSINNINILTNTISSTNTDGAINLTPNGTGSVVVSKADINSGEIDGATIGANSAAAGTFTTATAGTIATNAAAANISVTGATFTAGGSDENISITLTPKGTGALSTGAELKMKLVESASEPTLVNDGGAVIWKDTDDSNAIYLLFRRGNGDQVSVELT